ncbi:MAG: peptidoglycan DD-metalloendopeptidase family protein [Acutalibacteraceae bacterium]
MTALKKSISIMLVMLLALTSISLFGTISADAAVNLKVTAKAVTGVTATNAKISAVLSNPNRLKITKVGFDLLDANKKKIVTKTETCNSTVNPLTISYDLNEWYGKLKPGTKYYYRIFTIYGGKTYTTGDQTFTTKKASSVNLKVTANAVTGVTTTNAKISAVLSNPNRLKITKVGFDLLDANKKKIVTKTETCNSTVNPLTISYDLNEWYGKLKPGTKYYYRIFTIYGGKTYTTGDQTFTTKKLTTAVTAGVSGITKTNAVIKANVSNPNKKKIIKVGVLLGTASDKLNTDKSVTVNTTNTSYSHSFNLNSLKVTLKKGTKYYYRTYAVVSNSALTGVATNLYLSPVSNFETEFDAVVKFPLPTKYKWKAETYKGHGEATAGYSAIDLTLQNGKSCAGIPVYAVQEGTVVSIREDNGQVAIKHTKKLTTTNGKTYTSWYSVYAHMTDISVKVGSKVKIGQQIGKVGNVGMSKGAHLHFQISNGKKSWATPDKNLAISPYYVTGFVKSKGVQASYLKFGVGPYCSAKLYNWQPK